MSLTTVPVTYHQAKTCTIAQKRDEIIDCQTRSNCKMLVAIHNERIVGLAEAVGGKRSLRTTAVLAISVDQSRRRQGIGRALLKSIIHWARLNPELYRLELEVFANNQKALSLYDQLGFVREGLRKSVAIKHGVMLDSYIMGMVFSDPANSST